MPRACVSTRLRGFRASANRGFTLIELLIGISLTALLFISVYSTVRLAADGLRGVDRSVRQNEQRRVLDRFVQRQLEHAILDRGQGFIGGPLSMRFAVTSTAARTRLCRIYTRRTGKRLSLLTSLGPVDGNGRTDKSTLVGTLGKLRFSYFGRRQPEDAPRWSDRWSAERLPMLVRMTIDQGDGPRQWFFAVAGIDVGSVVAR